MIRNNLRNDDWLTNKPESYDQPSSNRNQEATPTWDSDRQELRFGNAIAKQFRWPAKNQVTANLAFEEQRWPKRIDDPVSQRLDNCPNQRLHINLKCLNRKQLNPLIKFGGDGTGRGVVVEFKGHQPPR